MKVWELLSILNNFKARAEVVISLPQTNCVHIQQIEEIDKDCIQILGDDGAILIDDDGNESDTLKTLSATC